MKPERRKAAFFILLVFFTGALTGAVATNLWVRMQISARASSVDAPAGAKRRSSVEKFTEELHLSREQASQLTMILEETGKTFRGEEEKVNLIRQEARNRIRALLSPDQRARYEEIVAERDRRRNKSRR